MLGLGLFAALRLRAPAGAARPEPELSEDDR
jgi:hypothetical protein